METTVQTTTADVADMADVAAIIPWNGIKRSCVDNFPRTPGVSCCYMPPHPHPQLELPWPKHNQSATSPLFREGKRGLKRFYTCSRSCTWRSQGLNPAVSSPKPGKHTTGNTPIVREPLYSLNSLVKTQTLPKRGYPSLHGNPDCTRMYQIFF